MYPASFVKSKILIISDTHGEEQLARNVSTPVDVVIHCGDLTDESKMSEFAASLRLLRDIPAPLKLVIAGNHDFTLDDDIFQQKIIEATTKLGIEPDLLRREFGAVGEARALLDQAGTEGIVFLDEGNHSFILANGARLQVYASPYTVSPSGDWGFQYSPDEDHQWEIGEGTDIVITHGPPKGVLDYTASRQRAGSASLFAAVAHAKPKVHCFGHVHEGWGAKSVAWRSSEEMDNTVPSHFTAIDNDQSDLVESLSTLKAGKFDTEETAAGKRDRLDGYLPQGHVVATPVTTCHAEDGQPERRTLFVNASIESREPDPAIPQLPWLIEVDLSSI